MLCFFLGYAAGGGLSAYLCAKGKRAGTAVAFLLVLPMGAAFPAGTKAVIRVMRFLDEGIRIGAFR